MSDEVHTLDRTVHVLSLHTSYVVRGIWLVAEVTKRHTRTAERQMRRKREDESSE